jgi:hypothetical protein
MSECDQTITEQKPVEVRVKFELDNIFKWMIPPALFTISLIALIKTDGKYEEIHTAVGTFTVLSFFRCLF